MTTQRLYSGQDVIVTNPMAERAGCRGHLYATSSDGYGSVEFPDGMLEKYRLSALSAAPTLKMGDRVKTTQDSRPSWLRGKEGVVVPSDSDDKRLIAVDMADGRMPAHYEADELEIAPKREPKAGEVWRMDSGTLLLIGRYGGFFNLNRLTAYTVPSATTEYSVREGDLTFAAASLKDAAALGLL